MNTHAIINIVVTQQVTTTAASIPSVVITDVQVDHMSENNVDMVRKQSEWRLWKGHCHLKDNFMRYDWQVHTSEDHHALRRERQQDQIWPKRKVLALSLGKTTMTTSSMTTRSWRRWTTCTPPIRTSTVFSNGSWWQVRCRHLAVSLTFFALAHRRVRQLSCGSARDLQQLTGVGVASRTFASVPLLLCRRCLLPSRCLNFWKLPLIEFAENVFQFCRHKLMAVLHAATCSVDRVSRTWNMTPRQCSSDTRERPGRLCQLVLVHQWLNAPHCPSAADQKSQQAQKHAL